MPLLARLMTCPLAIEVRSGAVGGLADLLADQRISAHGDVALVLGPGQGERLAALVQPALGNAEVHSVNGGTVQSARRLADALRDGSYDAVVGIGGGRTIDVAKYAASLSGLPIVSVPTSLAHDGLASPVASLEHRGRKGSYGVQMPIGVVIDLDEVRRCPPQHLRSGVGDALSNLNAVADWELAGRERGERVDGLAAALARSAGEAVLHHTGEPASDRFLTTLAEALVLGGLAMAAAGSSRPCSGACHEIAHAIDELHGGAATHGEQVAVGALFACWLRDDPVVEALDDCLRRHGVPRLPGDIGLTEEQFADVVLHAPSTRPERYTILEHLDMALPEIRHRVHDFVVAFDR
jgi:glycerol-1-phosphate dehydrogenase [NAD(P)+]